MWRHDASPTVIVTDQDNHPRELSGKIDELRHSLASLRRQPGPGAGSSSPALEKAYKLINELKTLARRVQNDAAEQQASLDRSERDAWEQRVRRADTTAKLKDREHLLDRIHRSFSWKIIKPIWKLWNRSRNEASGNALDSDITFALDLPKQWATGREVLLIKGWCFSRSGRELAGVRVKIGRKSKLARYGLERRELTDSFSDYPAALRSGFTAEVRIPAGTSTLRLEAIEQGSPWKTFFERPLHRERSEEEEEQKDPDSEMPERIPVLPALTASRAFDLIRPGLEQHAKRITTAAPIFSVITPCYNTQPKWLAQAALSLINQRCPEWEWCIVDDGSNSPETRILLDLLSRVGRRVQVSPSPAKGISAATNHALDLARGDYVCFLDHDDLLHPDALARMQEKLREGYDAVYSDEDKLEDASGELVEPFFKPDWSPEYFRGVMYVGHLLAVRRELAEAIRFDSTYDGVQDFEFMLRLSEASSRIGHIPAILYHWRKTPGSVAERTGAKPQIGLLQERAVNAHLERVRLPARAEQSELPHRLKILPTAREHYARVTIIIPSRDAPDVLGRCLRSVFEKTSHPNFEVIVMDNETTDERALALMREYPVRQIPFPNPFNFSRANNQGAAAATGELLVFLNNDTEVIAEDWLQHLAYYAEQPDVGAAGVLLAYDDLTVQHAGVALGMRGTADHTMRRFPILVDGYAGSLACAREVSAVTGACLMIRKTLFEEIGGFNEHYFTAYQDVDVCLRLRRHGLRIICTPRALLLHDEFISRTSYYYDIIDRMLLLDQWEDVIERGDPYYNPNLDLDRGDYSPRGARA
jgi:GT2 family glycosyltransferase